MIADRRVFFIGDSFVAGVGDPDHRGWVGRLAARSHREGAPITAYNLGVRRDTSDDVCRRWPSEVAVRRAMGCDERLVVSFGVNDTTVENGTQRVGTARSVANLQAVFDGAVEAGLRLFAVGPPPVDDPDQNGRIEMLSERFRAACAAASVPYVGVFGALVAEPRWMSEVRCGDGSHPGAGGYELLADLVLPQWRRWIGQAIDSGRTDDRH
jgi:acyl-CoA thioesterase-1